MKTASLLLALLATLLPLHAAPAKDSPPPDPLEGAFFQPDLVMFASGRISLTQEQREALRARIEKAQPRFDELRQRLERESAALAALAKKERVDEAALTAQLDKLLDAERDMKRVHFGLLVAVKNLLTPEQQATLRKLAKEGVEKLTDETRQRLSAKVERVQAGAQKWADSGRDPSAIAQAMQDEFKPLIEAGKVSEAEAVLDRLLKQLEQSAK